jgi:hypothetical protein
MINGAVMSYLKKTIGIAIIVLSVVSFASLIARQDYLIRNRPKDPQPELDRVYEFREHDTIVYITKKEKSDFYLLFFTSFGLAIGCVSYIYLFDPFDQRKGK